MRNRIFYLIITAVLSLIMVMGIYEFSKSPKLPENGFVRIFPPHVLSEFKIMPITNNTNLIGYVGDDIYMHNAGISMAYSVYSTTDHETRSIPINLLYKGKIAWKLLKMKVCDSGIFMAEGISPNIFFTPFSSQSLKRIAGVYPGFMNLYPIDSTCVILKTYDPEKQQSILLKYNLHSNKVINSPGLLKKQVDGIFCTEGDLVYDPMYKRFIYLYRYRNEFFTMNTDLQLLGTGHTIDNIQNVRIAVGSYKRNNQVKTTLSSPNKVVNVRGQVSRNNLFVQSAIRASNEMPRTFQNNTVVDIYSLQSNTYLYSFYIPEYKDQNVRDFIIIADYLVVLYEDHLIRYSMNLL
ncbi:hypothetical protein [Robertkochia solimangrovi]|uniref:hypothetical protein n=1 Tax=Robertkochia solimangrovi TaxID=2213046 RepID=UPI00117F189A|nr:hypothetical protein [Robertkochia solimangrovi]TRZ46096.1 hypothetical protein DMZ48_02175 [Robertkochia solimangrovi]